MTSDVPALELLATLDDFPVLDFQELEAMVASLDLLALPEFELPALPAGTYTLVGWYEGEARITRSVVVPPGGWAEIDLVVP